MLMESSGLCLSRFRSSPAETSDSSEAHLSIFGRWCPITSIDEHNSVNRLLIYFLLAQRIKTTEPPLINGGTVTGMDFW